MFNLATLEHNEELFRILLIEAGGVEKPDMCETKTFYSSFFVSIMGGSDVKDALRSAIAEAKTVLANPSEPRPPLVTRSYLNWRDQQRAEQGLPPITNNDIPQRGAFPPAPPHLAWNQN